MIALEEEESQETAVGHRLLLRGALERIRRRVEEHTFQAFWQTEVDGRNAPEVAAALGMTPHGVRKARSRVRQLLKAEFKELL